ncbi:MAG: hypothetical protein RM347_033075 [Nostoc sp. ChiQUE02]|uniref:hypothetical protein n=1 Tax=Nostoc sp. ChiQUE02 TaxID=3075377 RepID=UPI002AD5020A|nr:hypothetical protein [Nostoc sp. ChiQUE02]MDZ8233508.1 hypothetical protein [Nostoc sp. ChiQUE02]
MALDTTEGEQKLSYMESRREHLWHLLQIGMGSTSVPKAAVDLSKGGAIAAASPSKSSKPSSQTKRTRKKPVNPPIDETASAIPSETSIEPAPKKKQTRKKTKPDNSSISEAPLETNLTPPPTDTQKTDETREQQQTPKKSSGRVGQRNPKRDTVGQQ